MDLRRIVFRGKTKDGVGFVYGDLVHKRNGLAAIEDGGGLRADIDETTIGQFTGLKDINEVEIYEGDIINACNDRGVIEFDCGVFGINWDYGRCDNRTTMYGIFGQRHNLRRMDDEIIDRIEIIGNIYDNPELINKEK